METKNNVEEMTKKVYAAPYIQNIGRMIVHTNGTTSKTNDPGGSVGGKS